MSVARKLDKPESRDAWLSIWAVRVYWRHLSVCTAPMACHIYQEVHSKGWLQIMPEVSELGTIGQRTAQHTKLSLVIPMTQVISLSLMPSTSLKRAIMDRYSI